MKRTTHYRLTLALTCAVVLTAGLHSLGGETSQQLSPTGVEGKKIIKLFGWDKPDTTYVRAHIATMEATNLDGVGINLIPNPPLTDEQWGDQGNYVWFTAQPATRAQYQHAVDDLRATKFTRFTDNFSLMAMRAPGRIPDWFDDDFKVILDNARVQAWACHEGGLKGVMIDVENAAVLNYTDDRRRRASFDQYVAQVHQCAKQFMEAMVREYPDIIVMLTHSYNEPMSAMQRQNLALEDVRYALLPAFIDGLIEGAGDRATVIDGCENTYPLMCYDSYVRFHRYADLSMNQLSRLPAAQRSRLQKAVAIWPSFPTDFGDASLADSAPQSGKYNFNADRFAHALYNAMNASDHYVWIWNAANCWWAPALPSYAQRFAAGRVHLLPPSFAEAVRRARLEKMNLTWLPRPPLSADHGVSPIDEAEDYDDASESYETLITLPSDWWFITSPDNCEPNNRDVFAGWNELQQPRFDEKEMGWRKVAVDRSWADAFGSYKGVAYYRCRFDVPQHLSGRLLHLAFAGVAGDARVWGAATGFSPNRLLAEHHDSSPFIIDGKGAAVPGHECVLTVEVSQWHGQGGLQGPVRLVAPRGESTAAPISGRHVLLDLAFDQLNRGTTPDDSEFQHTARVIGAQLVDGRFGKALKFDGQDDAVIVPDSSVFDLPDGELTWELWYKADAPVIDTIAYHNLITKTPDYTNGLTLNYLTHNNAVVFMQCDPEKSPRVSVGEYGRWHQVVATYANQTQRLYYDGRLADERFNPNRPMLSGAPICIGGGSTDARRGSRVTIDAVRLYNYALSADEVQERYRRAAGQ